MLLSLSFKWVSRWSKLHGNRNPSGSCTDFDVTQQLTQHTAIPGAPAWHVDQQDAGGWEKDAKAFSAVQLDRNANVP